MTTALWLLVAAYVLVAAVYMALLAKGMGELVVANRHKGELMVASYFFLAFVIIASGLFWPVVLVAHVGYVMMKKR